MKNTMNYQLLKDAIMSGEKFDYLFFWGDTPPENGGVSKSCLSQWYAKGFEHKGEYFATAEHWMMAAKAQLFLLGFALMEIRQRLKA